MKKMTCLVLLVSLYSLVIIPYIASSNAFADTYVSDNLPPVIKLISDKIESTGKDIMVKVKVTDDNGVKEATFFYVLNNTDLNQLKLKKLTGDEYAAFIPGRKIKWPYYIDCFIEAVDTSGNTALRWFQINPLKVASSDIFDLKLKSLNSKINYDYKEEVFNFDAPKTKDRDGRWYAKRWILGVAVVVAVGAVVVLSSGSSAEDNGNGSSSLKTTGTYSSGGGAQIVW